MMDIHGFETADLAALASADDQRVLVILRGSADSRILGQLSDLLGRVHEETVKTLRPEVVMDVRDLEFMNSSCLKIVLTWIMRVRELAQARYRIRILSNSNRHWQRRTLDALSAFAAEVVRVES